MIRDPSTTARDSHEKHDKQERNPLDEIGMQLA
jgi:hypothetical protein